MKKIIKYKIIGFFWGFISGIFIIGLAFFNALAENHLPTFRSIFEMVIFLPGFLTTLIYEKLIFANFEKILSSLEPLIIVLPRSIIIIILIFIMPIIFSIFTGIMISKLIFVLLKKFRTKNK